MQDIQTQINEAIEFPEGATQEQALRKIHKLLSLSYLETKVEKFNPTLVDTKLIFEMIAALTTIISAGITIRTFLNLFIKV